MIYHIVVLSQCGVHRVPAVSRGNFIGLPGDGADGVLRAIQGDLEHNPERGARVPGLGGVRKARIANPGRGKGKRGGYRYLYMYLETRRHIHLLLLLDKNEHEDASEEQRKQIRQWVAQVKRDAGD
jgi:hypothetical protein